MKNQIIGKVIFIFRWDTGKFSHISFQMGQLFFMLF